MKNKICMICKMTILIGKEEFVEVKHYSDKEEILSKGYYHIQCYRDRLNGGNNLKMLQEKAARIIDFAGKKMGIEEQEVITI